VSLFDEGISAAFTKAVNLAEDKKSLEVPKMKNPFEFPTLPAKGKKGKKQLQVQPQVIEEPLNLTENSSVSLNSIESDARFYDQIFRKIYPEIVMNPAVTIQSAKIKTLNSKVPFEVHITEVWSPDKFWFQFSDEILNLLVTRMTNFYEKSVDLMIPPESVVQNLLVAAKVNNVWLRARVVAPDNENDRFLLFFVDYGATEHVDSYNIRFLLKAFTEECEKALCASLYCLKPKDNASGWSAAAKQVFFNFVANKKLFASIRSFKEDSNRFCVELCEKPSSWPGISEQLIKLGFADWAEAGGSFPYAIPMSL
jgi:hypothetical protein